MHRRNYTGRKLGKKAGPRKRMMRSLCSQVILYESITTTLPKAKEVRPVLEKLITKAKEDSVARRRDVARFLSANDKALEKLFEELGPLYKDRQGGYVRIVKVGNRPGDNTMMAQIQLLDTEKLTKKEVEKKEAKSKKAPKTKAATTKKTAAPKKKSTAKTSTKAKAAAKK